MAIKGRIQILRGLKADFDPSKLLPGEWAVSIDSDTNNQIVWMCFAAGVVKSMGTYEDFKRQIEEATVEIKEEYLAEFQVILDQIEELAEQTSTNTDTVVTIRNDFVNTYLPQMLEFFNSTKQNAESASTSASAAKNSETNAKASEKAAKTSETNAKASETAAATSESNAATSATAAEMSATNALAYAETASLKAEHAATSEQNAKASETAASGSASTSSTKAGEAATSATNASNSAKDAESYAHGGTGTRTGEDTDNSKYYYEQTKQVSQSLNGIIPQGTVIFANLPTSGMKYGYMYNISDAFTSDERFNDGGGVYYGAGNNVIWVSGDKWDVTAGSCVTGIKGNKETTYRQGNVNITAENVGALATDGDSANNTTTFTSNDGSDASVSTTTGWATVSALTSGEKHSSIFNKISTMFKNVRYLYKLIGSKKIDTVLSGYNKDDGTFTNASNLSNYPTRDIFAYHESVIQDVGNAVTDLGSQVDEHISTSASTSVIGHVKFGTASGTACQGNDSRLSDSRTPKSHASTGTSYGAGSTSNYGHVKLTDSTAVTDSTGLALPATEKNASIEGTLANKIGLLENSFFNTNQLINKTSIRDMALSARNGISYLVTGSSTTDIPAGYSYSCGLVLRRTSGQLWIILFKYNSTNIATCCYNEGIWLAWSEK